MRGKGPQILKIVTGEQVDGLFLIIIGQSERVRVSPNHWWPRKQMARRWTSARRASDCAARESDLEGSR